MCTLPKWSATVGCLAATDTSCRALFGPLTRNVRYGSGADSRLTVGSGLPGRTRIMSRGASRILTSGSRLTCALSQISYGVNSEWVGRKILGFSPHNSHLMV